MDNPLQNNIIPINQKNDIEIEKEAFIILCTENTFNTKPQNQELNKIQTSKYTWYNCIPKILFEQFSKMSNIYFLIIAIFQCIKEISNADGRPIILMPLTIIVAINGLKDYYEDWKRRKSDDEENHRKIDIYNYKTNKFESKIWQEIRRGNIIKIRENEFIPADCILLYSSNTNKGCFLETKNLDGETNLKIKKGINTFISKLELNNNFNESNFNNIQGVLKTKYPNEYIYEFNASFVFSDNNEPFYIGVDSFLLRGCSLKQTKYVYALTVYTGHDSKIMKNSPNAKHKISSIEHIMNNQIIFIFIFQIVLSVLGAMSCVITINKMNKSNLSYIFLPSENYDFGFKYFIYRLGTWIVLLNNLVPISLLVTMEMVKYVQGFFISWDCNIYDKKTKSMTKVQTSTLNEELGQVKYIFSDKTGTLTKNFMVLKQVAVGNKNYQNNYNLNEDKINSTYNKIFNKESNDFSNKDNESNIISNDSNPSANTLITSKSSYEDSYGKCTNVEFSNNEFDIDYYSISEQNEIINLFFSCIVTCHSINIDQKEYEDNHKVIYQSSSQDETAILNFARLYNLLFMGRDINNNIIIKNTSTDEEYSYKVLCEFEYTSERKSMGIIVMCPDNIIRFFVKGADSLIFNRLNRVKSINYDLMLQYIDSYAKEGLRTLALAYKTINENELNSIQTKYNKALNTVYNKDKLLNDIYDEILNDLILLGITGIEDKLQDNIDDAIYNFNLAGIKFWLLTGDKKETAKSIAMSCKLINKSDFYIFEFEENLDELKISNKLDEFILQRKKVHLDDKQMKFAIIISQNELSIITSKEVYKEKFYYLATKSSAVLCCRVTPKQKSQMVLLIKEKEPNSTTLAIGDGANDVNMITTANIGVGIYGVEGKQAARASDYAIGEFQFLKRLLLVHGRESYRKNSFIVCYNFYKNFIYVIPQFILGFQSLFGGLTIYDPFIYQIYNILYAAFPIIWFGFYDKEFSFNDLISNPKFYIQGIEGGLFGNFRFWKFIFYGFAHGLIIYLLCFLFIDDAYNSEGDISDVYLNGIICYSFVVIIVNVKVLITTSTHSFISFGLFFISIALYYLSVYLSSFFINTYNFARFSKMCLSSVYYLKMVLALAFCNMLEVGLKVILKVFGIIKDPMDLMYEYRMLNRIFVKKKNDDLLNRNDLSFVSSNRYNKKVLLNE